VRSYKAVFKVFVINKIGDFFVIILFIVLYRVFGTSDLESIRSSILLTTNFIYDFGEFSVRLHEFLGVFLVLGGSVKSAQLGFHI
jgi:NADH:ubiquinone oxidoreductase subunit 5 (subunit L)/multisubunit Na+/H+ antiporter MnhA subunit